LEQALLARGVDIYRVTPDHIPAVDISRVEYILNYGVSDPWVWESRIRWEPVVFNPQSLVEISANKLRTMRFLTEAGIPTLDYTTDRQVAEAWIADGKRVFSRTVLGGRSGRGIVLSPPDPLPQARLYTKSFGGKYAREYRVYIVNERVVDLTEKRRLGKEQRLRKGLDHTDPYRGLIRAHDNGWVFARSNMIASTSVLEAVKELARRTGECLHMGFGVVDIIARMNRTGELIEVRVVEPNTAPAMLDSPTTLARVTDALASTMGV